MISHHYGWIRSAVGTVQGQLTEQLSPRPVVGQTTNPLFDLIQFRAAFDGTFFKLA